MKERRGHGDDVRKSKEHIPTLQDRVKSYSKNVPKPKQKIAESVPRPDLANIGKVVGHRATPIKVQE
mgnify:CR=1 FL=1